MKTTLECIPCLARQAIEASGFFSDDPLFRERVLKEILREISESDFSASPPVIAARIHRRLREISGVRDPYREIKKGFNSLILSLSDRFRERINSSSDPMLAALRMAIAGNVIDSGAKSGLTEDEVLQSIESSNSEELHGDSDELIRRISEAKNILYITDNAGEIVLDRLFIEKIGAQKVTLAVRGCPVINDATIDDARQAGLDTIVKVVENGSDAPGTILSECSDEMNNLFRSADLVISKGQGNYETLSDSEREIFFLLKVKCPIIADHTSLPVGTHAIIKSRATEKKEESREKDYRPEPFSCRPIGIIRSEHVKQHETPIQPVYAKGCKGYAEIFPEYAQGLKDLDGFSHIYIIFQLHKAKEPKLIVKPFLDDSERGVFATRSPSRPNPIGMSIVELVKVEGNRIYLDRVDMLDGTPIIDIKPYASRFDRIEGTRNGWHDSVGEKDAERRGRREYRERGKMND